MLKEDKRMQLNDRLLKMRNKLWDTRPCITAERLVLATQAYQKFAGENIPEFRAKVVNYIMEHMTTLIMENELIVGTPTNKYRGANLHPEFQSSTQFYLQELDEFPVRTKDPYDVSPEDRATILEYLPYWEGKAMQDIARPALPTHTVECMGDDIITVGLTNGVSGETTCDHETLLKIGLKGYMEQCQANIDAMMPKCQLDEEKINYWRACIIQCQGLITYAHRMADEAERQAAECADEKRKKELLKIAEVCRWVPENPPRTFQEALQMIWFAHVYFHIEVCTTANGFGRFDQYMWPYYKKDVIDEKNITEEEAFEMLACLYLKACEVYEVRDHWYATGFAGYPMWEILVVGGQTPDGKDATNELSYVCLEVANQLKTTQPVMAVRVWDGTPEALVRKGCEMIQDGQANPGFFNDYTAMQMALGKGCTIEEARDWTIVGCIQPGPGGGSTDGSPDAGYVNMGKVVNFVLHNGVDPDTGKLMGLQTGDPRDFKDIEEFKDALKKQILYFYRMICDGYNVMQSMHQTRYPVIFASMLTKGCVESGRSVQHGGAKYTTAGLYITGAANLADSIAAIDTCVYKDKLLTMDELIHACDTNFEEENGERIRQLLLNRPPKFGNDNEYVDGIYHDMMQFIAENVQKWPDARGGWYSFNVHSQTVNVAHGEVTGATPDGRKKGEPFCDNASPMMGRDTSGPTATVKSVASMGQASFHDGALFNLRFDPKGVEGEKGLQSIEGVIRTYFKHGGEHIQINVVDTETLRDAQIHPEMHKGLMVRVAGYMAYFTELDKSAQDTIIYRTAHFEHA